MYLHLDALGERLGRRVRRRDMFVERLGRHIPDAGICGRARDRTDLRFIRHVGEEDTEETADTTGDILVRLEQCLHVSVEVIDRCDPGGQCALHANVFGYMTRKRDTQLICRCCDGIEFFSRQSGMNFQKIVAGRMLFTNHRRPRFRAGDAVPVQ